MYIRRMLSYLKGECECRGKCECECGDKELDQAHTVFTQAPPVRERNKGEREIEREREIDRAREREIERTV